MRPPRYRFPEEVRATTRGIASRMIREEGVARSPEQLAAWIAERPEVREPLVEGGYGTAFTAEDLYPLLAAFLGAAAGPPPEARSPSRSASKWFIWGLIVLLVAAVLLIVLAPAGLG
jgi:hypothetical protein